METESTKGSLKNAESEQIELAVPPQPDVDGFSCLELLAEGATGIVFSARRIADDRQVALKIYKKELIPDSQAAKRFQHEVDALRRISHPNIVEIIDAGQTRSGLTFIAMEMIDGVSIRTILETEGVFEPRRAVTVTREVCRALRALHAKEIIHRDIKPNNIIVDASNVARLVDFGIAKVLNSSNDTLSQYGTILGTPAYMSPEQCLGQKIDERSDIYSVGCTLFEMLTGTQAFASATAMEAVAKQIDSDRSFIEKPLISAGASSDLRQIISRCLSREPEERYKSVEELDHELGAFLLGAPLSFPVIRAPKKQAQAANAAKVKPRNSMWQIIACCAALIAAIFIIRFNLDSIGHISNRAENTVSNTVNSTAKPMPPPLGTHGPITILERTTRKTLWVDPTAFSISEAVVNAAKKGVSLHQADLHEANLQSLNLSHADLSYADLSNANLNSACLTEDNLHGAILTDASMVNTQLFRDDLSAAKFMSARMRLVQAPKSNFTGADFSFADLSDARCLESNFRNANFTKADLGGTVFRMADLSFADFNSAYFKYRRFNFEHANLTGAKNFPAQTED